MRRKTVYFASAFVVIILAIALRPAMASAAGADDLLARAQQLENAGQFKAAARMLSSGIAAQAPSPGRRQLEFELDRLGRIRLDYPFTHDSLFASLQRTLRGITTDEFDQWIRQGRFDYRNIDGTPRFMSASVANLFWRYPELNARKFNPGDDSSSQLARWQICHAIALSSQRQGKPYVLPKRFDATMTLGVDANTVPAGQIIRAWLPIPRNYPYQNDFKIISASPPMKNVAPPDSPIRSAYFEEPAPAGAPAEFTLHFRFTRYAVCFDIDPKQVTPFDGKDQALLRFTRQAPHVLFTPAMRNISTKIVGKEKNPALIAKKIYDWIGSHIQYSFATEYSTIPNISDYCLTHRYGDCGEEAMLFITLCRLNNIPARWQSGWDTFPGQQDIHDWSEIYLAPYGWVPVDPCLGLLATRYMTSLSPAQRQELHDFYFGGLDPYRMAANSGHSQILAPPKNSFRSDNVDFQRGELESGNQNIYFNHSSYQFDVSEVVPARPH